MFSNRERRKMEMRMGGPEMAGAPRDLGQSPSTGQSIPASEAESARDARCYTSLRSPTLRLREAAMADSLLYGARKKCAILPNEPTGRG